MKRTRSSGYSRRTRLRMGLLSFEEQERLILATVKRSDGASEAVRHMRRWSKVRYLVTNAKLVHRFARDTRKKPDQPQHLRTVVTNVQQGKKLRKYASQIWQRIKR